MKKTWPARLPRAWILLLLMSIFMALPTAGCGAVLPLPGSVPLSSSGEGVAQEESFFTPEKIKQRIVEIEKTIETLQSSQPLLTSEQVGLTEGEINSRLKGLESLIALYQRYLSVAERAKKTQSDFEKQKAESQKDIAALVPDNPPYSLSFYENYRGRLETLSQEIDTVTYAIRLSESAIVSLKEKIRQNEQHLAMLKEEQTPSKFSEWVQQEVELETEKNRLSLAFREKNVEESRLRFDMLEMERKNVTEGMKWIAQHLQYDEADLKRQVSLIKERERQLQEQAETLRQESEKAREEFMNAQARAESASDAENLSLYRAQQSEKETWYVYYQAAMDQAEQAQVWAEETREIWETRYSLLEKKLPTAELIKRRTETEMRKKDLDNVLLGLQKMQVSLQSRLLTLDSSMASESESSPLYRVLRQESEGLKKQIELNGKYMTSLLSISMLNTRLLEELESLLSSVTITEKVSVASLERLRAFLNFQLWSGDGFSVSVKKLILAVIIVLLGFIASRKATKGVKQYLLRRFEMDPTAAMAIQKGLFAILVFICILAALDMVNIPLTAFAFLGGALALGVGIGAQNIFSNLISGLILFFSKPFRVHDIVEIEDIVGTVEEIESRSTRIRTFDNVDVLVPNRYFLENRIVNWTRTDQVIRGKVKVGVAYGSPAREVERLLLVAASSHKDILTMPEPYVIFNDFGSSSLDFDLYFWVDMRKASRFVAQSDLRYKIIELFEERNITIAFPQLDIHFDKDVSHNMAIVNHPQGKEASRE